MTIYDLSVKTMEFTPSDTPEKTEYFNEDVLDEKSIKQENKRNS